MMNHKGVKMRDAYPNINYWNAIGKPPEVVSGPLDARQDRSLMEAIDKNKEVEERKIPISPIPPKEHKPDIEPYYINLGENLGMCGYELRQLFTEIKPENELVMSALRKLISAIKISEEVDFSEIHSEIKRYRQSYERDVKSYEDRLNANNIYIRETRRRSLLASKLLNKHWLKISLDIQTHCVGKMIKELDPWYEGVVSVLRLLDDMVEFDKKNKIISISNRIQGLHYEAIKNIKNAGDAAVQKFNEHQYAEWLSRASWHEIDTEGRSQDCQWKRDMANERMKEIQREEEYRSKLYRYGYNSYGNVDYDDDRDEYGDRIPRW